MSAQADWAEAAAEAARDGELGGRIVVDQDTCPVEGCTRPPKHRGRHTGTTLKAAPAPSPNGHVEGTVRITLTVPLEALLKIATVERVEA